MLSETTQELLVYQNDLTAKIFLLCVIFGYMLYSFWRYNKLEFDTLSNKIAVVGHFVFSRVTLFFFPLMSVGLLHLNVSLDEMIVFIGGMYTIVFVVTFGLLIVVGFEKILEMLQIKKGGFYK